MALSRQQKEAATAQISRLLADSKMTVLAHYQGTPVKAMQQLRAQAKDNGTVVKVVKNRLFKLALKQNPAMSSADLGHLTGQLLYAFNAEDEAAPAQVLAEFAKTNPQLQLVGALAADGRVLGQEDTATLAKLPTKDQLRAQLAATISSPVTGTVAVLAANVRGVLNVLGARFNSLQS